jgi:microsomal dipeptidase-like Zn-dependent dipeptidase
MARRYPFVESRVRAAFNLFNIDLRHCHEAGIDLICATHFNVFDEWLSMPTDPNPAAIFNTVRMLDQLEQELDGSLSPYASLVRNRFELETALQIPKSSQEWRVTIVHTVEGGHALGGDLQAIEMLAGRGVAMLGLTHFFNKGIASSPNAFPFFPDAGADRPKQGLSGFGREVVSEMERCGMIVDVAHCTSSALEDVLAQARRPLVASHVAPHTLAHHPYSLVDEHLQEIAERGGIIGIILDPFLLSNYAEPGHATRRGSIRDAVRAIRYVYKLCGRQHVCVGSDAAGFISPPREMRSLSEVGTLRAALLSEFNDREIVDDILANNVIDFLTANWGC